jgi:hypothetical protein
MEEYIFNSEFFCLIFFSARSLQNTQGPIGPGQWKIGLRKCPILLGHLSKSRIAFITALRISIAQGAFPSNS